MDTYGQIPFYFITTNKETELTLEAAKEGFAALKEAGYSGAVLFNKPPLGFSEKEYLTDKWFWAIENFIQAGLALGLSVWINDGFDFPPGAIGGRIAEIDDTLCAYHLVRRDGRIVPERAAWGFPAFENPKSSRLFIRLVYEEYKRRLGKYFGKGITGFFSDADNRRVTYRVFAPDSPERDYFPWAEGFADGFYERYGYDVTPYLPQIMNREEICQAADYWEYSGELYQSWFRANRDWCHQNGLLYTFHTSDTSPLPASVALRSSVFTEGRAVSFEAVGDYCGTDQELLAVNGGLHYIAEQLYTPKMRYGEYDEPRHDGYYSVLGDVRTKQAQSAAFLYDRRGVMCELFAAAGWNASYERLREIAAFQIMQGANLLVHHAVHHRLRDGLKFFAPPVFLAEEKSMPGVKQFVHSISGWLSRASGGTLAAPIAVLDITRELWAGKDGSRLFLKVCHRLNQMPQGYVIADEAEILANRERFSLVINTGELTGDEIGGIRVLNVSDVGELERIEELVPCNNRYMGEGCPHYMRRRLPDGDEALLVANIEDGREIRGTVCFENKTYEICLETGEIAYFSNEEKCFHSPVVGEISKLPHYMEVTWENDNILPLMTWRGETGVAVLKSGSDSIISFSFAVEEGAEVKKLFIPKVDVERIIKIEGITLTNPTDIQIFDDAYISYDIHMATGQQKITVVKTGALAECNRIFLTGDFDVFLHSHEPYEICYLTQYNLEAYLPAACEAVLMARSRRLNTMRSAAEQGHPFYCGALTYHADVALDREERDYLLELGETPNYVIASINGKQIGESCCRPLHFPFRAGGEVKVSVKVSATYGNFLECWRVPFGMLEGGSVRRVE